MSVCTSLPPPLQSLTEGLILGGEFAMWGDMWTVNRQCWDEPNWQWLPRAPVAHWMHDQEHDQVFMDSMAGLVSFTVCRKCDRCGYTNSSLASIPILCTCVSSYYFQCAIGVKGWM